MAVNRTESGTNKAASGGRRLLVGTNVIFMIVLAIGVVGVIQAVAYYRPVRWDMTSSAANSLSEGTENLLRGLQKNVRLTSLYFKTDMEEEDQQRYRSAADNLLALYESSNRSKIAMDWFNPLSDHEKMKKLAERLRNKTSYKDEIAAYKKHVDKFKDELAEKIASYLKTETELLEKGAGAMGAQGGKEVVGQVENLMTFLTKEVSQLRSEIDTIISPEDPQYSSAVNEIKRLYRTLTDKLKKLVAFGTAELARNSGLPLDLANYLKNAGSRSSALVTELEEQTKALDELQPLKVDSVLRELRPNGNPIIVETDDEAMIVEFENVWPPVDQTAMGRVPFSRRAFKGEELLTSAILRITHKEQTAVVFVRYGGQSLFMGGLPGQGQSAYGQMKKQLEETNFSVHEWDLKASPTLPEITPPPTRTLFVVLKPNAPERGPMGQQSPDPPFGEKQKQAFAQALGDKGRALFIGGWDPAAAPNPMSPMPVPSGYEWNDYLKNTWGVTVDASALLVEFTSIAPGRYMPAKKDFMALQQLDTSDHDIVRGAHARLMTLPWSAPLVKSDTLPAGVTLTKLVVQPKKDGVWGIKDFQEYQEQHAEKEYLTRVEGDPEGPFDLAVAATKGDSKMVLVSSRDFAEDSIALAQRIMLTGQGLVVQNGNPGNVTLFINSLHWLNDNTQFLNIGKPINAAVLEVEPSAVTKVKVATIALWPALALVCGGVAWWVRRR